MKRILHISVGNSSWLPTDEQLKEVENLFLNAAKNTTDSIVTTRSDIKTTVFEFDDVKVTSNKPEGTNKFVASNDKRTSNNPTGVDDYNGPDDVSLNYRQLSDLEKQKMGEVKLKAQELINSIRSLKETGDGIFDSNNEDHPDIDFAIRQAQIASMWAIRFLTASSYK